MVPLDSILETGKKAVPGFNVGERRKLEVEPAQRRPHRFKVLDVMTRRVLADVVGAREAVAALAGVRSVVDVSISVWDEDAQRWRLLSFAERRALWDHRPAIQGP
jgi:hypothetical protein